MEIRSNPYRPDAQHCCEACVFGRGDHESFCPLKQPDMVKWVDAIPTYEHINDYRQRAGLEPYARRTDHRDDFLKKS